jgi:hypothetical protein
LQPLSHTQYDPDRSGQFFHKPPDNDGHPSQTGAPHGDNSRVPRDALTRTVQDFLGEAAGAVVLEDGAGAFDLAPGGRPSGTSRYCLPQPAGNRLRRRRRGMRAGRSQLSVFRAPYGPQHPLFRLHSERWLESLVVGDVSVLDEQLESASLDSPVPGFSPSEPAMLDVPTVRAKGDWR